MKIRDQGVGKVGGPGNKRRRGKWKVAAIINLKCYKDANYKLTEFYIH